MIYFFSETIDSNDYLRLLNSIWNDHIIRSVRKFEFILYSFYLFRYLFVNYLLFWIEPMFYTQVFLVFGIYSAKINRKINY